MTNTEMDPFSRLRPMNPVPDPDAVVDAMVREETLRRVLEAPPDRTRRRVRQTLRRRAVLVAAIALVTSGGLLVAGERRTAPGPVGVLPALAEALTQSRGILHVRERTFMLGAGGERLGAVHVEEGWTLLDDARVSRFKIGTGRHAEQGARDREGTSEYDPESTTVTIRRQAAEGPEAAVEPPVVRMAKAAARGKLRREAGPVIRGRPTIELPVGDGAGTSPATPRYSSGAIGRCPTGGHSGLSSRRSRSSRRRRRTSTCCGSRFPQAREWCLSLREAAARPVSSRLTRISPIVTSARGALCHYVGVRSGDALRSPVSAELPSGLGPERPSRSGPTLLDQSACVSTP